MSKWFLAHAIVLSFILTPSFANSEEESPLPVVSEAKIVPSITPPSAPFTPFTAKVVRDRVRLRIHPSLEAPIFQEMAKGDLLIVTHQDEDFYAVKPLPYTKAYVYRTFVLDDVVEGNHVNVRLQPDTEAPVLAQLNAGNPIHGHISPTNPKWLEIDAPENVRFYVYKDYVENIGDEHLFTIIEARREEVNRLLETAYEKTEDEFAKEFDEIDLIPILAQLQHVTENYTDFPEQIEAAQKEQSRIQEIYLQKKIAFLEGQQNSSQTLAFRNKQLSHEVAAKEERIHQLEKRLHPPSAQATSEASMEGVESIDMAQNFADPIAGKTTHRMIAWLPHEEEVFTSWLEKQEQGTMEQFYEEQKQTSELLKGVVEVYDRPLKNRPGDFMLLDPKTRLPIAFLYSTQCNLEEWVGKEVAVNGSHRPNNHYAYPAYCVLDIG